MLAPKSFSNTRIGKIKEQQQKNIGVLKKRGDGEKRDGFYLARDGRKRLGGKKSVMALID